MKTPEKRRLSTYSTIIGHTAILEHLDSAQRAHRIHHAYLFVGPPAVGKRTVAEQFVQNLFCSDGNRERPCSECRLLFSGNHPDVVTIQRDAPSIGVEEVRAVIERLRHTPARTSWSVAIIPDAERMSESAMNALLKTLEEPARRAVLLLTSSHPDQLLPTLRSRCHTLSFRPVTDEILSSALKDLGIDSAEADWLSVQSGGAPGRAVTLINRPEERRLLEERLALLEQVLGSDLETRRTVLQSEFSGDSFASQRTAVFILLNDLIAMNRQRLLKTAARHDYRAMTRSARFLRRAAEALGYLRLNTAPNLVIDSLFLTND